MAVFCVKCAYHQWHRGDPYHLCKHPDFLIPNYVTGIADLPQCSMINVKGNCVGYEEARLGDPS